ncbi:chemotaxis protein CheA [Heliorestis acidaminivorans]|uniref:Chemotaxis protein CheA n=1 Tax=Heliorestis acidaminivorans TaxID=553427 RepID=A0A6I0EZM3_9FIRM|nr:chemotaxis protein CheA [Heliorestis acidaminivorans]KAB2951384.1 chemotaxis protein CheA [Heliorestis acidaminivorans]
MDKSFMDEYLDLFYSEAKEQLEILSRDLLSIESGTSDEETIHQMFRAAHSLKGASASVGFQVVANITHNIEDLLGKVREGQLVLDARGIDAIFNALDFIQAILFQAQEVDPEKAEELIKQLEEASLEKKEESSTIEHKVSKDEDLAHIRDRYATISSAREIEIVFQNDCIMKAVRAFLILNNLSEFGEVLESFPAQDDLETCEENVNSFHIFFDWKKGTTEELYKVINVADVSDIKIKLLSDLQAISELGDAKTVEEVPPKAVVLQSEKSIAKTADKVSEKGTELIKVEASRLDYLMNLIGELLISQTRFARIQESYIEQHGNSNLGADMAEETHHLARLTSQLQDGLMKTRMVPIGTVFNRFPRLVRDLARKVHKKINLVVEGQETELDKSMVDLIGEPLMHLLRNAIDHGIETPEERMAAGKPPEGTVILSASHEGSRILIKVADDGKGIDEEKVLAKARRLNLVEEGQELTKQEIYNLLFSAGLSTAQKVTDVSGRGVGMDVVRRNIMALNGMIEVQSEKGQGSSFIIQLPITLAIIQGLLVSSEGEKFIIPLDNVLESFQLRDQDIDSIGGNEVFTVRGSIVPIKALQEVLQIDKQANKAKRKYRSVVMIGLAEQRMGLEVDELLGQREIVIKTVNAPWLKMEIFAGATILGDGRVSLIINVATLFARCTST